MSLATEADLYYRALRLGPPDLATAEPGPVALTGPGEVSRQDLRPALDQCGQWLNDQFGPHLKVLIGVPRADGTAPGLYFPGEAAPLPGPPAQLDGLRAPAALLWFGDPAVAGAGLGALLVQVGWGAQTVRTVLREAGYRAVLDTRAGLVRLPGGGTHLGSVLVEGPTGAGA
ncbi:hypothetical protein [Streptomyces sp. NBC_00859]|uniref:hypothetical protein n=1 Tax=Streptomyces sp. NBC_00859 TaxID=2903682 RepID=UPI00387002C3|nr:hypothetical protein OG584_14955 [Streptomyces sp. NBC_00859]